MTVREAMVETSDGLRLVVTHLIAGSTYVEALALRDDDWLEVRRPDGTTLRIPSARILHLVTSP